MSAEDRAAMADDRQVVNLKLRLSPALHAALVARSDASGRSLNGELVRMLEDGLRAADLVVAVRETVRSEMRAERDAAEWMQVATHGNATLPRPFNVKPD